MPQPRKPSHLKKITGSRQPDARQGVVLPLVDAVPKPPDWLSNAHATKEWKRLAPILVANKLLTDGGLSALGVLCALHGKIAQMFAVGQSPSGHMVAQYRNLIGDFGLTPLAQGKVKAGGAAAGANKFSRNGVPQ